MVWDGPARAPEPGEPAGDATPPPMYGQPQGAPQYQQPYGGAPVPQGGAQRSTGTWWVLLVVLVVLLAAIGVIVALALA